MKKVLWDIINDYLSQDPLIGIEEKINFIDGILNDKKNTFYGMFHSYSKEQHSTLYHKAIPNDTTLTIENLALVIDLFHKGRITPENVHLIFKLSNKISLVNAFLKINESTLSVSQNWDQYISTIGYRKELKETLQQAIETYLAQDSMTTEEKILFLDNILTNKENVFYRIFHYQWYFSLFTTNTTNIISHIKLRRNTLFNQQPFDKIIKSEVITGTVTDDVFNEWVTFFIFNHEKFEEKEVEKAIRYFNQSKNQILPALRGHIAEINRKQTKKAIFFSKPEQEEQQENNTPSRLYPALTNQNNNAFPLTSMISTQFTPSAPMPTIQNLETLYPENTILNPVPSTPMVSAQNLPILYPPPAPLMSTPVLPEITPQQKPYPFNLSETELSKIEPPKKDYPFGNFTFDDLYQAPYFQLQLEKTTETLPITNQYTFFSTSRNSETKTFEESIKEQPTPMCGQ